MQNIGVEFKLKVHSNRWGHKDTYNLTKTEKGWVVGTAKGKVESDTHASPGLEKAFTGEGISYPADLGYFLSDIWEASQTKSEEEVQGYFDKLGEWISTTEATKPDFSPLAL
ncbi:hypothetical protein [Bacillus cereus]|uniref:hypothetical protein n=1 Tax=Bacillus cereus TaxID=1396 RepID=UPI0024BC8FE3|nr:hypothetical protein [Bacillus cereus]WLG16655.1 hypothetical protein QM225_005421 [Bacillus cereus]